MFVFIVTLSFFGLKGLDIPAQGLPSLYLASLWGSNLECGGRGELAQHRAEERGSGAGVRAGDTAFSQRS
jgi:hypothetical protein